MVYDTKLWLKKKRNIYLPSVWHHSEQVIFTSHVYCCSLFDWEGSFGFWKLQYELKLRWFLIMLYLKKNKKQVTYLRLQNKVWMKSVYYAVKAELIMEHCGEELNIYTVYIWERSLQCCTVTKQITMHRKKTRCKNH